MGVYTVDDGGISGGDLGALAGPDVVPDGENCIVVDPPDNTGIVVDADGNSCVVLPRQPPRPEEQLSGDPDASDDPPMPT